MKSLDRKKMENFSILHSVWILSDTVSKIRSDQVTFQHFELEDRAGNSDLEQKLLKTVIKGRRFDVNYYASVSALSWLLSLYIPTELCCLSMFVWIFFKELQLVVPGHTHLP